MLQRIRKWSQKGQGIVEYALILAFVVAVAAVALTTEGEESLGYKIKQAFINTGTAIENKTKALSGSTSTGGGGTTTTTGN